MSIPVLITDGNTNIEFIGGAIPVSVDLEGATINATFPDTVNTTVTNTANVNIANENFGVHLLDGEGSEAHHHIDPTTNSAVNMQYEYHEIIAGHTFRLFEHTTLAKDAVTCLSFKTMNTKEHVHLNVEVSAGTEAVYEFFEAPVVTGGSTVVPHNLNRVVGSDTSNTTEVKVDGTLNTTNAIELDAVTLGVGRSYGGDMRDNVHWILAENTVYAARVTNLTNGTNNVSLRLTWFEHANKDGS